MRYRLTATDTILFTDDAGAVWSVPKDPRNRLRADYEAWVSAGNVADPYVPPPPTPDHVDGERDRRVSSGFMFQGKLYQSRVEDQKRINGAGTLAAIAIMGGAQAGNLRWHGGTTDFVWIAGDNTLTPMDAQTVIGFRQGGRAVGIGACVRCPRHQGHEPDPAGLCQRRLLARQGVACDRWLYW
jgi:hypothetical protein